MARKPRKKSGSELPDLGVVELRAHGRLEPASRGDALVSASIGPDGHAIAVWSDPAGESRLHARQVAASGASFAKTEVVRPPQVRITAHRPEAALIAALPGFNIAFPTPQPLPNGHVLLAGARCRLRADGPERSAIVVDEGGNVTAEGTLGDGIEHVLTTARGDIWVGYFDEGVFGNLGWGSGGGSQPIGAPGLRRFGRSLAPEWSYPEDAPFGGICDCYALNVEGETAWICYYTDFPIVRVRGGELTGWRNEFTGAKALITDGRRLALIGGYEGGRDRVVVGELTGERFVAEATCRLALPGGEPLAGAQLIGRGAELHALVGTQWLRLSLYDLGQGG